MKKIKFLFGSLIVFSLVFSGCSNNDGVNTGSSGSDTSSSSQSAGTIVVNGAVNDAPVSFAKVRLVLYPSAKELASITADANGMWSYSISKDSIPSNTFIMILATNPANDSLIRSIIDTDDVLAGEGNFETDETTVSHYTEAAIAIAETDTGINQEEFNKIKSLILLDNGVPSPTGFVALDELATVVKTSFDSNNSSQDKLSLSVYKKLLQEKISKVVPDKFGRVKIALPVAYNNKITTDVNLSTGSQVNIVDETITFDLTPQEAQSDVNLTISATLNSDSITKTITLYAKGNSKNHYIYKAVAPSSEPDAAQTTVMINGRYYTVIPYSFTTIQKSNANINSININATLRGRSFNTLKIADNYLNTKTLIKVYEGKDRFDFSTLVGDSGITTLASNQIDVGNIELTRINDFRPIAPKDKNIEMPPAAPQF